MQAENGQGGQGDYPLAGGGGLDFGRLEHTFESLWLTGMEARTMVALLRLGAAMVAQLSHLTGISRSNLYPVLDSLGANGLCQRVPGRTAVWVSPEPHEVFAILQAGVEARRESARRSAVHHLGEAQALLAALPETKRNEAPITLVDDARLGLLYNEAMASVDTEILVLNRGPYAGELEADSAVLAALARGVKARALYVSGELDTIEGLKQGADVYAREGVELRVIDRLPAAMAVIGHETVLLALPSSDASSVVASSGAVIRHQGMVELQAAAFEQLWAQGRPYLNASSAEATPQTDGSQSVGADITH